MSADVDTSRSTSGYVMTYAGGAVSWQWRLQKTVALSTTEAEYIAFGELGIPQDEYRLYCHNESVIHLEKNATYHSWTKDIQRRYYWIRERVEEREFVLTKIHTTQNGSNMLTKVLTPDKGEFVGN